MLETVDFCLFVGLGGGFDNHTGLLLPQPVSTPHQAAC